MLLDSVLCHYSSYLKLSSPEKQQQKIIIIVNDSGLRTGRRKGERHLNDKMGIEVKKRGPTLRESPAQKMQFFMA